MTPERATIVLPSPGKGKGLFARVDLPKGAVVARMQAPARMRRSEVAAYVARHNLPHDCVIHAPRSPFVFYDAAWDGRRTPRWYRLNHSRDANCKPVTLDPSAKPRDRQVVWVTTRAVRSGEELLFRYDKAPASWG